MEVNTFEVVVAADDDDIDNPVDDVVLGLQAIREPPKKVLSKVEKMKWSPISYPSSLYKTFNRSQDMEKVKTKLTIDAFRPTQMMPPSIPSLKIVQIDQGSPIRKPDEILDESLLPSPFELFVTEFGQQIISSISYQVDLSDKCKGMLTDFDNLIKSLKKSKWWSKEQLQEAMEETIQIQTL